MNFLVKDENLWRFFFLELHHVEAFYVLICATDDGGVGNENCVSGAARTSNSLGKGKFTISSKSRVIPSFKFSRSIEWNEWNKLNLISRKYRFADDFRLKDDGDDKNFYCSAAKSFTAFLHV